jgi:hypothetical protein
MAEPLGDAQWLWKACEHGIALSDSSAAKSCRQMAHSSPSRERPDTSGRMPSLAAATRARLLLRWPSVSRVLDNQGKYHGINTHAGVRFGSKMPARGLWPHGTSTSIAGMNGWSSNAMGGRDRWMDQDVYHLHIYSRGRRQLVYLDSDRKHFRSDSDATHPACPPTYANAVRGRNVPDSSPAASARVTPLPHSPSVPPAPAGCGSRGCRGLEPPYHLAPMETPSPPTNLRMKRKK